MYVKELVNNEHEQWKRGDIIFINSGTGTGKSHFVRNELSELSLKERDQILFIFNRSKLEKQNQDTLHSELNFLIKTETYQDIENKIMNGEGYDFSKYKYIVCDEYHYFTEDSLFNDNSDVSFDAIMKLNSHIRLFMSATGHTIFSYIKKNFEHILNKRGNRLWVYNQKYDFSHIASISFYKDIEVLERFIHDQFPLETDKVLWFCRSIKLAEKLHKKYPDSSFMCSKSSNNKKYFQYLSDDTFIEEDNKVTFKGKFLFTTKVLDNGFDLKDENIKLIVCDYFDLTTIIQCIGRKRMMHELDKVHIVLINYSNQSLGGLQSEAKKVLREANAFIDNGTTGYIEQVGKYGRRSNYIVYDTPTQDKHGSIKRVSRVKYLKVESDLAIYERILEDNKMINEVREGLGNKKISDAFIQFITTELNQKNFTILDDEYGMQNLEGYLESIMGKKLFKDEQQSLIERIDVKRQGHQIKSYKVLNSVLVDMGLKYVIESLVETKGENRKKTYWIIGKITFA